VKVLHLHSGNLYGGVETFLLTLARLRHLAPSMDMSVALCFDERIAAELRREAVPTSIFGAVRLRRPDTVWHVRQKLAKLLSQRSFDVAVCHQAWPLAVFGPVLKASGLPIVSWTHMARAGNWLEWLAERTDPDVMICNSEFTASLLPPGRARVAVAYYPVISVTLPPVPPERSQQIRQELRTSAHDIVVIQVSRMEALKGQTVCLEAMAQLRDRAGWTCWQVGGAQRPAEAQYLQTLRDTAHRTGIADRVRFVGERTDVPDLLSASDIYCQPNVGPEGFGITFVEAMAAGVPVVTSRIGGAVEVVNDSCGVLVPYASDAALASSVATSLDTLIADGGMRKRLGDAGRARARALCDPATQMGRIAEVLESACRPAVVH
jgi:glycosyltransferase involved in cell wall biosynthesis